jgi:hypothetical protein
MNDTTAKQLEALGEYGYFFARNPRERTSARHLAKLMQLVEREDCFPDGKVFYVYRIRKAAIESVLEAYE